MRIHDSTQDTRLRGGLTAASSQESFGDNMDIAQTLFDYNFSLFTLLLSNPVFTQNELDDIAVLSFAHAHTLDLSLDN